MVNGRGCGYAILVTTLLLTAVLLPKCIALVRLKRQLLLYPPGSSIGIFLAIAVPVDLPNYQLAFSYNFEGSYLLPTNATELALGPNFIGTEVRYARSLTRTRIYQVLEEHLANNGMLGRACLLRTICETVSMPIHEHNGLLGDLVHLIFTPSTSESEGLPKEFEVAENLGHKGSEACRAKYSECSFDLYDLFSVWNA